MNLSHDHLYRLPFSTTDNPIGWLEVTDTCNIHCRGCYRQQDSGHKPLGEIIDEIRVLREVRNCDGISVAGGEPTCHPGLEEIVGAIRDQGMKCTLVTNGVALDRHRLTRLRDAGLTHLGFHVDRHQARPGWEGADEVSLMDLRQQLVDLCVEVGGVQCNMGMTVYPDNLQAVPAIVRWAQDNYGRLSGLVFITYRGVPIRDDVAYLVGGREVPAHELGYAADEEGALGVNSEEVAREVLRADPSYQPSSYLNGTQDHTSNKWLVATRVGRPGRTLGYLGPRVMELHQSASHLLGGRYVTFVRSSRRRPSFLSVGLVDPVARPALGRLLADALRHPLDVAGPVYTQSIVIVQAPDVAGPWGADMCDGCPDLTLWKGKLVNSCRLDEVKRWGGFITMVPREPSGGGS